MPSRRPIKDEHELYYINAFLEWHRRAYHSRYRVMERQDPPDALIQSGNKTSWIEIADVFWTDRWAEDLSSYATPGEVHRPIDKGVYANMDEHFSERFVAVLRNKLSKNSYSVAFGQHGPGYLVLPMMSPFFSHDTIKTMRTRWLQSSGEDMGFFRSVFIAYPQASKFQRWSIS